MPTKKTLGRPKGASSEETRARLLLAARVAFSTTGYASTTNQEIAQRAGVTAAAVYQYFDSKMALYLATVREGIAALSVEYRRATENATTTRDSLRAILECSAAIHAKDPSLASFLSALPVEMRRHPELTAAMLEAPSEIVGIFERAISLGVKSGEIKKADGPRLVALFVACTMGFSLFAAAIPSSTANCSRFPERDQNGGPALDEHQSPRVSSVERRRHRRFVSIALAR
jgi:AcrR family transcriptional regulator